MKVGAVLTCGPGRLENLTAVLSCLSGQGLASITVVHDGGEMSGPVGPVLHVKIPKHEPGAEQPRNVGVRVALEHDPDLTHVWFLDSDILVEPGCLERYREAGPEDRVLVGPYEWMPGGLRRPQPGLRNDPRWPMFLAQPATHVYYGDLSAGLACWGGNLIWPVADFQRVGGFWSELYHGRCEDGELGLRAVSMGIGISMVAGARGWHLWHPRNQELAMARNERDVPMLNARHPWVEGSGVFVIDEDGKAFAVQCPHCHTAIPTNQWWMHAAMYDHDQVISA